MNTNGQELKDWTAIRERYLRDSLPIRLGGLAANLSRMRSFAAHDEGQTSVMDLLEENKHYIEWTAAECEISIAAELVNLQIQMAIWQLRWKHIWHTEEKRKEMVAECATWSRRVLEMSGLLGEERSSHITQKESAHRL